MSNKNGAYKSSRTGNTRSTASYSNRSNSSYSHYKYRGNYYGVNRNDSVSRQYSKSSASVSSSQRYGYYNSAYTAYNQSSVAHDYYYDAPVKRKNSRSTVKKARYAKEKEIVQLNMPKTIVSIAVIFTFALALICAFAINSSYRSEIASKQTELAKIIEDNQYLKTTLEDKIDLNKLAIEAEKIGLQKPQAYQITEVQVPNESYTVQYDAKIDTQDKSVWEFLKSLLKK